MFTLEDVRKEYDKLDALIGIDTRSIQLCISKRAVKQLGCFIVPNPRQSSALIIKLSNRIFNDERLFYETVRHEYAHAAVYILYPKAKQGHNKLWKDMCIRIGCSGNRLVGDGSTVPEYKYIVRCTHCGQQSKYLRRGKIVNALLYGSSATLVCNKCSGRHFELLIRK